MPTFDQQLARLSITLHRYLGALALGFVVAFVVVITTTSLAQIIAWVAMVSTVTAFAIVLYVSERLDDMVDRTTADQAPEPTPARPHLYVVR